MMFCCLSDGLIGILESHRGQQGAYIGCMKSGDVISEEYVIHFFVNTVYHILGKKKKKILFIVLIDTC